MCKFARSLSVGYPGEREDIGSYYVGKKLSQKASSRKREEIFKQAQLHDRYAAPANLTSI